MSQTREKSAAYMRAWRADNPERSAATLARYRNTLPGRVTGLWVAARARAKKQGIPFTITKEWLSDRLIAGVCEATGLPLELSYGNGRSPWSPSIDQIVPAEGYTPENARVVCWLYNGAKGSDTDEDVIRMATALLTKLGRL